MKISTGHWELVHVATVWMVSANLQNCWMRPSCEDKKTVSAYQKKQFPRLRKKEKKKEERLPKLDT